MSSFYWIGNNLALDLANTLAVDEEGREKDLFTTFDDLLSWVVDAGLTSKEAAARIKDVVNVSQKKKMVDLAGDFRTQLKAMAKALAGGKAVPRSVIESVNEVLRKKEGHFELLQTAGGYGRKFRVRMNNVTDFLVPVAESAMDLLCYGDLTRVKKCEGTDCVLYFYDTSKPGHRRWCSMAACGNRAKAAAFYDRTRLTSQK